MTEHNSPFLQACRGQTPSRIPVWLMRQAGRYMRCYRDLRQRYPFLQMVHTPELACEVTLQPIRAFELDAAIVFADILPLLGSIGLQVNFVEGKGPQLSPTLQHEKQITALQCRPLQESIGGTLQAITLAKSELNNLGGLPLIGFSGAPFTLASYAIEGGGSRQQLQTKSLLLQRPDLWRQLMQLLSQQITQYLLLQAQAGADALQLFDSWVGCLSPQLYEQHVLPYLATICSRVKQALPQLPLIYFSTGSASLLPLFAQLPCDVFGVDWRLDLADARRRLPSKCAIQGNLDPVVLLAPWSRIQQEASAVLQQATQHTRAGYIFNLGHGVLPATAQESVKRLVQWVHEQACC
ncbi:MAG: uroporphyrinogen decarboxylase [Myxococcota bacterium]